MNKSVENVENDVVQVEIKEIVEYAGHSISANGAVSLTVKASYSELPNSIQMCQLLNNDVTIKAKVPGEKAMMLGMFRVKNINIEDDGENKIKFAGLSQSVEVDNLNRLPLNDSDTKQFKILVEAEVEIEREDDEEGDDW